MKHTSITLLTLTAAAGFAQSAPAAAPAFTVTGNVAVTSDYVWRGVTQSAGHTAIQGGFDLSKTPVNGLTAGVWASSLSAGAEIDLYANYGFKVGAVDLSIGYINYQYTKSATGFSNFSEANIAATYAGVTAKVSKGVSGTSDYYYEANYSRSLDVVAKGLSLGLHYGMDRASKNDDYGISLTYPIAGLEASIGFTDIQNGESVTAFSVKKSF